MKNLILSLFFLILLSSFSSDDHETYLSVTEIEYRQDSKSVQVISRVFIDDMEDALSRRFGKQVSLAYKKDLSANKDLLEKYYSKKLSIQSNNKDIPLKLLGSKFDADQIVLFLEGKNVEDFTSVEVENLVLTDLFDTQKNIVHVKKGDIIESMLLVKSKGSGTVKF
ncbi:DUF6702 family protein [Christiangramia portivictoriae]|uniref:DUF6702 family protein n=1 Tax=Christiangramia portivictoriae TaxID=326069 RepID=UPI0004049416|nr:DUF6702 family protein [Christiangramia portivictoriae]